MKRTLITILMLVSIISLYPSKAYVQDLDDEYGYIGLYADHERTSRCIFSDGGVGWLWCRPSKRGLERIIFRNQYPSNVTPIIFLTNDAEIDYIGGDEACGWTIRFNICQTDWIWVYCYSIDVNNTSMSSTDIAGECFSGSLDFQHCDSEAAQPDSVIVLSNLLFNYPLDSSECTVGVDEISWGAIKSIYKNSD